MAGEWGLVHTDCTLVRRLDDNPWSFSPRVNSRILVHEIELVFLVLLYPVVNNPGREGGAAGDFERLLLGGRVFLEHEVLVALSFHI